MKEMQARHVSVRMPLHECGHSRHPKKKLRITTAFRRHTSEHNLIWCGSAVDFGVEDAIDRLFRVLDPVALLGITCRPLHARPATLGMRWSMGKGRASEIGLDASERSAIRVLLNVAQLAAKPHRITGEPAQRVWKGGTR